MFVLRKIFDAASDGTGYAHSYSRRLGEMIEATDLSGVNRVVEMLEESRARGSTIFVIANGGSSAVASHIVNDLGVNCLVSGKAPFRVVCLSDNVESVTAVANDAGYQHVFEYQLRSLFRPGDVVLAMSVSGNSENVIRGVQYAKENDGHVIGWYGFDGGRLKGLCDVGIHVPSTHDEYGPVEDVFGILGHIVATFLAMRLGRQLHH